MEVASIEVLSNLFNLNIEISPGVQNVDQNENND